MSDKLVIDLNIMKYILEIITPPISIDGFNFSSFIATNEKSLIDSEKKLQNIKNNIKNFI